MTIWCPNFWWTYIQYPCLWPQKNWLAELCMTWLSVAALRGFFFEYVERDLAQSRTEFISVTCFRADQAAARIASRNTRDGDDGSVIQTPASCPVETSTSLAQDCSWCLWRLSGPDLTNIRPRKLVSLETVEPQMWRCWLSATASRAKFRKIRMARFKIDGRLRQQNP